MGLSIYTCMCIYYIDTNHDIDLMSWYLIELEFHIMHSKSLDIIWDYQFINVK